MNRWVRTPGSKTTSRPREADWFSPQAHILEYGLAVHEKVVPQDMRPLHKKLVDQFHLMKSSLGIQVMVCSALLQLQQAEAFNRVPPSPPPPAPGVPWLRARESSALHQREPADLPELCAEHHQPGRRPRGVEAEVSASSHPASAFLFFSFPFPSVFMGCDVPSALCFSSCFRSLSARLPGGGGGVGGVFGCVCFDVFTDPATPSTCDLLPPPPPGSSVPPDRTNTSAPSPSDIFTFRVLLRLFFSNQFRFLPVRHLHLSFSFFPAGLCTTIASIIF